MSPVKRKERYDFAIVCALPIELAALQLVFDCKIISTEVDIPCYKTIVWSRERQGFHNCIIATTGKREPKASAIVTYLINRFDIEKVILTGIACGVPNPQSPRDHVRLGDIVISEKVIKFMEVKLSGKGEKPDENTPSPDAALVRYVGTLVASFEGQRQEPWMTHISKAKKKNKVFGLPNKKLWPDVYQLENNKTIEKHPKCEDRIKNHPLLHLGVYGSSPILLKDPAERNKRVTQYNIKAFEMESGGVGEAAHAFGGGYIVIKGTCDYGDGEKKDGWQKYAALVSAAFTKALLEIVPSKSQDRSEKIETSDLKHFGRVLNNTSFAKVGVNTIPKSITSRINTQKNKVLFLSALDHWTAALKILIKHKPLNVIYKIVNWPMSMESFVEAVRINGHLKVDSNLFNGIFPPEEWTWVFVAPITWPSKFSNKELLTLGPAFGSINDLSVWSKPTSENVTISLKNGAINVGIVDVDITSTILLKILKGKIGDLFQPGFANRKLSFKEKLYRYQTERDPKERVRLMAPREYESNKEPVFCVFTTDDLKKISTDSIAKKIPKHELLHIEEPLAYHFNVDIVPRAVYCIHASQFDRVEIINNFLIWLRGIVAKIDKKELKRTGCSSFPLSPDMSKYRKAQQNILAYATDFEEHLHHVKFITSEETGLIKY